MSLSTQPYKGARDFYPEDKRIQKYMFAKLREAAESFGYEEYDAPILEPLDLYAAKSGAEIVNEQTYTFTDRGGREVAIRPEMTPTVSRMVAARRQDLGYPLRLYSIPNLWRYERPQRGRLREHWQLNVDLFGLDNFEAEIEIIMVSDAVLQSFGAGRDMYEIRLNDRTLVDAVLGKYLNLNEQQAYGIAKLIDRKAKMDGAAFDAAVVATLGDREDGGDVARRLSRILEVKSLEELPAELVSHAAVERLRALTSRLGKAGIHNVRYDPTLMRGFDYYTGTIFEVFDLHPDNNRSMYGGGRYDGLVGLFGVEPVPTIGFGMGDVTLQNFLESHDLLPDMQPETDLYVVLIGDVAAGAQAVIRDLRHKGLRVAVDYSGRKPDKQIKTALKKGVNSVLFIGDEELNSGQFKLRNLTDSSDAAIDIDGIVATLSLTSA